MTQTITEDPEKTWDLKDLAKALESTGELITNAQRYREERDEWVAYAERLEKEIKVLKDSLYVERLYECKKCDQKTETNRRLLIALDKAKKEGCVASRKRSKTVKEDSQKIVDDWAKSC